MTKLGLLFIALNVASAVWMFSIPGLEIIGAFNLLVAGQISFALAGTR